MNRKYLLLVILTLSLSSSIWLTRQGSDVHAEPTRGLAAPDRDTLQFCVDIEPTAGSDNSSKASAAATIGNLLIALQSSHPLWGRAEFGSGAPSVDAGCPDGFYGPPEALTVERLRKGAQLVGRGKVSDPLPYKVLVFVLSDSSANGRLGTYGVGRSAYEVVCEGNQCWEVTTALWIPEAALADESK